MCERQTDRKKERKRDRQTDVERERESKYNKNKSNLVRSQNFFHLLQFLYGKQHQQL